MEYSIVVVYQNKFLFKTDNHGISTTDDFIRLYKLLLAQFPEADGFKVCPQVTKQESIALEIDKFAEAVLKGRGKGYLLKVKNAHRKASQVAHSVFMQIMDGIF